VHGNKCIGLQGDFPLSGFGVKDMFCLCVENTMYFFFQEHFHYDVVKSADAELKKATIQINVFKQHRQTVQVDT
jgi:hypothetical protein